MAIPMRKNGARMMDSVEILTSCDSDRIIGEGGEAGGDTCHIFFYDKITGSILHILPRISHYHLISQYLMLRCLVNATGYCVL